MKLKYNTIILNVSSYLNDIEMYSIVYTQYKGRCVVANESIKPGTNLIIEDPFSYVLFEDGTSVHDFNQRELEILRLSYLNNPYMTILASRVIKTYKLSNENRQLLKKLCTSNHPFEDKYATENEIKILLYLLNNQEFDMEYSSLIKSLSFNTFTIEDMELKATGLGLYLQGSAFNHSCDPNAYQTFVNEKLYIRSNRYISKGDEICISYIDIAKPSWWRREVLYKQYNFYCNCFKCSLELDYDFWKCKNQKCNGVLVNSIEFNKNKFINWIRGDIEILNKLAIANFSEYSNYIFPSEKDIRTYALNDLCIFSCTKCSKKNNNKKLMNIIKSTSNQMPYDEVEGILNLTTIHSISRFEVLSFVTLKLLHLKLYDKAYHYSSMMCESLNYLYPEFHPQTAIIKLQHARLLIFLHGSVNREAEIYMNRSRSILKITHCDNHPIFDHFF